MLPTIKSGDAYLLTIINDYKQLKKGDIIVYYDSIKDTNIVHRIVRIYENGVITRGDNNNKEDPYLIEFKDIKGIVKKIVRGDKEINLRGGRIGLYKHKFLLFNKKIIPIIKKPLKIIYNFLAKIKLFYFIHNFIKIEIIQINRDNQYVLMAVHKGKTIGKKSNITNVWEFKPPYKLFINPRKLL